MKLSVVVGLFGLLIITIPVRAETAPKGDPVKGEQIATQACAACHAADGNSEVPTFPKLAGQQPEYIVKQLGNFKSGERTNSIMSGMAAALTPEDMKDLGAYFASRPAAPGTINNKELVNAGRKIFKGGNMAKGVAACAACHGPNGAGMPVQFPRLAGQHADYIVTQLSAFKGGERANDSASMMRMIATKMTDQEMKAVAEYISGLQ